jgi:hypothetical protein
MPRRLQALRPHNPLLPLSLLIAGGLFAGACSHVVDAASSDFAQAGDTPASAPIDPRWSNLSAYNARNASVSDADGLREGYLTLWHGNGVKQGEGLYVEGRKQGPWTWWYDNGQKRWEGTYAEDRPEGFERGWYENGMLEYEGSFQAEHRSGPFARWYATGQVELRGEYRAGRRQGLFRYWNYDGTLDRERSGVYEADQKVAELVE